MFTYEFNKDTSLIQNFYSIFLGKSKKKYDLNFVFHLNYNLIEIIIQENETKNVTHKKVVSFGDLCEIFPYYFTFYNDNIRKVYNFLNKQLYLKKYKIDFDNDKNVSLSFFYLKEGKINTGTFNIKKNNDKDEEDSKIMKIKESTSNNKGKRNYTSGPNLDCFRFDLDTSVLLIKVKVNKGIDDFIFEGEIIGNTDNEIVENALNNENLNNRDNFIIVNNVIVDNNNNININNNNQSNNIIINNENDNNTNSNNNTRNNNRNQKEKVPEKYFAYFSFEYFQNYFKNYSITFESTEELLDYLKMSFGNNNYRASISDSNRIKLFISFFPNNQEDEEEFKPKEIEIDLIKNYFIDARYCQIIKDLRKNLKSEREKMNNIQDKFILVKKKKFVQSNLSQKDMNKQLEEEKKEEGEVNIINKEKEEKNDILNRKRKRCKGHKLTLEKKGKNKDEKNSESQDKGKERSLSSVDKIKNKDDFHFSKKKKFNYKKEKEELMKDSFLQFQKSNIVFAPKIESDFNQEKNVRKRGRPRLNESVGGKGKGKSKK